MVRASRPFARALVLGVVLAWTCGRSADAGAESEQASEYAVKAAYLFNFARFVTWPAGAFPEPATPLTICILGADPFGTVLDGMLADETVEGRKLAARRLGTPQQLDGCQILFVNAAGRDHEVLAAVAERPILTVGDAEAFALDGGMVGFRIDQSTVRLTVNPDALRRSGLTMSSQVMRLARIVPGAS